MPLEQRCYFYAIDISPRLGSAYIIQMTQIIAIVREYMIGVSGAKQWVLRRMVTDTDDAKRK